MKRIIALLLCIFVVFLFGCSRTEPDDVSMSSRESETQKKVNLPCDFLLGNLELTLNGISETKNIEFEDNGTKIKLNNDNGKYDVISYLIKNNEEYSVDIDHSVEVTLIAEDGNSYYGEYYEDKTGRENPEIKKGESVNTVCVIELPSDVKFKKAIFKYNNETYEYEK